MTSYQAIIIGATGAVGGAIVRALLQSARCTRVIALSRRPATSLDAAADAARLDLRVIDYTRIEEATREAAAGCAVAFCTVGIGQPRKVSDEEFRRVDVEYAGAFARGTAGASVRHLSLLSSVGANADSRNRYLRTKGMAERAVLDAGLERTSIFRPSLLVTKEIRYGLQDRVTQVLFPLVAPTLPRRYHQIAVEDLGRAMQRNAELPGVGAVEYLYYPEFMAVLRADPAGAGRSPRA